MPNFTTKRRPASRLILSITAADLAARYELTADETGRPTWGDLSPQEQEKLLTAASQAFDNKYTGMWIDETMDGALNETLNDATEATARAADRAAKLQPVPQVGK